MIKSFGDAATEDLFNGLDTARSRRFAAIARAATRKLDILQAAVKLTDLRIPSGNRLEALKGDLKGYYSIRINEQWRIVFRWSDGDAHDVRVEDYH